MRTFLQSARYAAEGIAHAIRTQRHIRFHLSATVLVCMAAAWVGLSPLEWAVLLMMCAVVISLEMINTAIELAIDRIGLERHPLAKAAKDVAAGAVLLAVLFAIVVGILLLGPPIWQRF
ncbi:diacylglycerol kinase family protein [Paenibacillus sp. MMS18-CY102]|uniref:diacylglycerol kinase family protein n=1 Tax=Paenibacillus sp. MMS18-CY102 TaxID=2682849 RepID=UPI0013656591|nr:diacylglycerol kinase family protein [Paenibacillus sp. MMS18-CY102]MWC27492.1 diacylglycerol kinase family protein [Paenibacillus sp. MMS18-CY102]